MFKRLLLIIIILSSTALYNFTFVGKFSIIAELIAIALILGIIIFYSIYDNSFRFRQNFSPFIAIFFISLPFSMLIADKFHGQSMTISLYAQRGIYFYLLYFALHKLKLEPKEFEKIFVFFAIIFILLYLTQLALYPRVILVESKILHERGTTRILLAGMDYLIIGYFLSLKYFLEKRHLKYTILLLASLSIIILIGSRTLLFTILAATLLYLLLSRRIRYKPLIYFLSALGMTLIYFAFQNIFQELIKTALYKDPINTQNIRYKALNYFLTSLFPSKIAYIFGNGADAGHSEYSHSIGLINTRYGFYLGDIGIIGDYVKYGAFFVLGIFGILYKVFKTKIHPEYDYIKYFYAFTIMAMILGGGFTDSGFIVVVCITLYMTDVSRYYMDDQNPYKTIVNDDISVQLTNDEI